MLGNAKRWMWGISAGSIAVMPLWVALAGEQPAKPEQAAEQSKAAAEKRPDPAPLADSTKKGLAYLAGQQNDDGGWGQGGGWRTAAQGGRVEGAEVKDPSDVGNTCVAMLALIRAGHLPTKGEYATHVSKGIDFVCKKIEEADRQSIWVTDVRDTQLQSKIGQYVDTFLAALVLSELKDQVPADKGGSRIEAALKKTIAKIETNQKEDGTFAGNHGWASVLSQGLCGKALNRAAQKGVAVRADVLKRDYEQAAGQLAASGVVKGRTAAAAKPASPDAGVKLYNYAANAGRVADLKGSQDAQRREVEAVLKSETASGAEKAQAKAQIAEFDRVAETHKQATEEIIKQMDDERFIAGFGNNGGEEFLSHMNISETLYAQGGREWDRWNKSISGVIGKVQNGDGSWSGHHCITGRTFCTSAALLTLMADRAPLPTAEKLSAK